MIGGLNHVAVGVTDLDAGLAFYLAAFGCELVFRSDIDGSRPEAEQIVGIPGMRADVAMLRFGDSQIELWQYRTPAIVDRTSPANGLGYPHIALKITDIDAEVERLTGLGMTFVGPPVGLGYAKAIYGHDPFGNLIELYETIGA